MHLRTAADVGRFVRDARRRLGAKQADVAATAGTGIRFLVDLEAGKETCQLGKALRVLAILGVRLEATPPVTHGE